MKKFNILLLFLVLAVTGTSASAGNALEKETDQYIQLFAEI